MGFNKIYIEDLETLKAELEEKPENIKYYAKAEALIGSSEAIAYLEDLIAKR